MDGEKVNASLPDLGGLKWILPDFWDSIRPANVLIHLQLMVSILITFFKKSDMVYVRRKSSTVILKTKH